MARYQCQLERLGAPYWACAIGGIILGLFVVVYIAIISISVWRRPGAPGWLLPAVWTLGALAVALIVRSVRAVVRTHSDPGAAKPDGPSPPDWHGSGR